MCYRITAVCTDHYDRPVVIQFRDLLRVRLWVAEFTAVPHRKCTVHARDRVRCHRWHTPLKWRLVWTVRSSEPVPGLGGRITA